MAPDWVRTRTSLSIFLLHYIRLNRQFTAKNSYKQGFQFALKQQPWNYRKQTNYWFFLQITIYITKKNHLSHIQKCYGEPKPAVYIYSFFRR